LHQDLSVPIKYFTDGSLKKYMIDNTMNNDISECTNIDIGAGFVVEHPDNSFTLGTYAYVSNWPSSTRAEIAAIFLALLTAPKYSRVEIHTDSQCAIDVLSNLH